MPILWTGVNMWGADAKGDSVFDYESSMQRAPPSGAVYILGARNRRKSDSPRRYRRRTGRRQRGVYSGRRSTGTVPRQVCGPRRREQRCPSCRRSRRVPETLSSSAEHVRVDQPGPNDICTVRTVYKHATPNRAQSPRDCDTYERY